jgi:protein-disulfide isomerase
MNKFVIVFSAVVLFFIGFLFFTSSNETTEVESTPTSHTLGVSAANVTFVEYSDFECPACERFYPIIQQLKSEYRDRVVFQFRHFPLVEIHQNALVAHRAAEAADKQGKFWEMHSLLFENQIMWARTSNPVEVFEDFAQRLEMDVEQFNEDLMSSEVNRAVQADRSLARSLNLTGTPAFFINDTQLTDAIDDVNYFKEKLDEALATADSETPENE